MVDPTVGADAFRLAAVVLEVMARVLVVVDRLAIVITLILLLFQLVPRPGESRAKVGRFKASPIFLASPTGWPPWQSDNRCALGIMGHRPSYGQASPESAAFGGRRRPRRH